MIGQIRDANPDGLTPEQFVMAAVEQWAKGDLFFRTFDPVLLPSVTNGGKSEFVIFREEGSDHYFGMPISATLLLDRLGFYTAANLAKYSTVINAILMRVLDREGFEFIGVLHAPIAYGEEGPVEIKQFDIKPARTGKILKTTSYLGYKMTDKFQGAWLLIPKNILIPQGVHNV
ncbi:hypothetical protein D3C84_909980 [compost metagenome]